MILAPVKRKENWGFIDQNGHIVIPIKYHTVDNFSEGLATVCSYQDYNLKYGYINQKDNLVIPFDYKSASSFHEGMAKVVKYGFDAYGFIDKSEKTVVPFIYNAATDFSGGIATVKKYIRKKNNEIKQIEKRFINLKGDDLFDVNQIESISSFKEDLAIICKGSGFKIGGTFWSNKYGYINKSFVEVISAKYHEAFHFINGYATVKNKDNKYGVIDKNGTQIIDFKFDFIDGFYEGLSFFRNNGVFGKEGYINLKGDIIINTKKFKGNFCEGMAYGREKSKMGFINCTGNIIIPFKYDNVNSFKEGFSVVENNNKYSFINKSGLEITNDYYDGAKDFSEGYAPVLKKGKWGFIDKSGFEVVQCVFDEVGNFSNINNSIEVIHNGDTNSIRAV